MIYNDCISTEPTPKQFTVLVIKPDAVQAGKVEDIVEKVGWSYVSLKCLFELLSTGKNFVFVFPGGRAGLSGTGQGGETTNKGGSSRVLQAT